MPAAREDCLEAIRDWRSLGIEVEGFECEVRSDGVLIYKGPGSFRIRDQGSRLIPSDARPATLQAALRMARAKFGSRFRVRGGAGFRRACRQASGAAEFSLQLVSEEERER